MASGMNGPGSSSTSSRTSLSVRSRTPRMYRSRRASSSAMVSALIMPRSATMQMRPMEKRWRRRSTTGTRLPVSAVLPGHISVQTGRIHENEIELGEQITPPLEQAFFDDVLETARCKWGTPILFGRRQFLAEPSHRPIEMMQIETLDAIDPVILPPPISGTVRSAGEQAMQHGEEDGAFECKPVLALTRELLDDGPAPGLLPQPFERESRPD